ncbi:MAG: polyprenyl diphosphate synthase [Steroidobacteraceae bacterium]
MHVAIIMDGNGRWAARRGLPRTAGHVQGAKAVSATVEAAARAGIDVLTLYAFSADNWKRPPSEVSALMDLFGRYLFTETRRCAERSIRINVIGRRDRLSASLMRAIEQSERSSADGEAMLLRIAVDYSSRHSIVQAAGRARAAVDMEEFTRLMLQANNCVAAAGKCAAAADEVDLLIRTGSEQRLSDFLLWECAYAELYFSDCLWPDFDARQFSLALEEYAGRQRRFGGLIAQEG